MDRVLTIRSILDEEEELIARGKQERNPRAIFECVERRTGEDYGAIEFDEFGAATEDSRIALRSAVDVDDQAVWWACEEELGVVFSHVAVSDK